MSRHKPIHITSLVAGGLSASLVFASGEAVLRYGVFGGLAMSLAFILAYSLLLLFARDMQPPSAWRDRLEQQVPFLGQKLLHLFSWFIGTELLVTQGIVAGLILHSMINVPFLVSVLLFSLSSYDVVLSRRLFGRISNSLALLNLSLIFPAAIFLPIYVYLQKGLETLYHDLLHYHPRVLHLEQAGLLEFAAVFFILAFAKLLLELSALQEDLAWNRRATLRKLGLTTLSWATVVMAFATMTIVSITERIDPIYANEQVILLIQKIASPTIFYTFSFVLLAVAFLSFLLSASKIRGKRQSLISVAMVIFFAWLAVRYKLSVLDLMFIFGMINGPLAVFLAFVYRFDWVRGIAWVYPLLAILLSFLSAYRTDSVSYLDGVLVGSGSAFVLLMLHRVGEIVVQKVKIL